MKGQEDKRITSLAVALTSSSSRHRLPFLDVDAPAHPVSVPGTVPFSSFSPIAFLSPAPYQSPETSLISQLPSPLAAARVLRISISRYRGHIYLSSFYRSIAGVVSLSSHQAPHVACQNRHESGAPVPPRPQGRAARPLQHAAAAAMPAAAAARRTR